jgi:multisubunit Na+/H+ antiporter MnhB subunit
VLLQNPAPNEIENKNQGSARFLWWRFGLITIFLFLVGLGFSLSWYCYPAPSGAETAIFLLILAAILIQTIQAGWYRNDSPWELSHTDEIFTMILVVLFLVIALAVLFLVLSVARF